MLRDVHDTKSAYEDWLLRARSRFLSLAGDGHSRAAVELENLLHEHHGFDPTSFTTTILSGWHRFRFVLTGSLDPDIAPGREWERMPARISSRWQSHSQESPSAINLTGASSLTVREAISQKLWISWTSSCCFCLSCPCPPVAAPSVDANSTHHLAPRNFHVDPMEGEYAVAHFRTAHNEDMNTREMLEKYARIGMSVCLFPH